MSILIRTGLGRNDLSYTDAAVKNLKVLQKTSDKTVQWITTAAGTTYQNILQKRGVKDLFYGDITIPSDVPSWALNPTSGSYVSSEYAPYQNHDVGEIKIYSPTGYINVANNNMFSSTKISSLEYRLNDMVLSGSSLSISGADASSLYFKWVRNNRPYDDDWMRKIRKLFVIDNATNESYVVQITSASHDTGYTYYYSFNNIFSNIKSINNSHTYTVGIRSTVS